MSHKMGLLVLVIIFALTGCGGNSEGERESQDRNITQTDTTTTMNITAEAMTTAPPTMMAALPTGSPQPSPAPMQVAVEMTEGEVFLEEHGVNPFMDTSTDHLSTFSMDVDTGAYTLARNYLENYAQLPPADSVRSEEFINYFDVGYPAPEEGEKFAIHVDAAPAPFGEPSDYVLRVGIQGEYIDPTERTPALLIFVIDVSGSMNVENRLPLVKEALRILVYELREDDRVGIVVYSDNTRVILEPTPASEKATILTAIDSLQSEGSTNMVAGLTLGYQMADAHRSENGITRVILLSDGVANVGITEHEGILANARDKADEGVTLSTIGFGMGDINDTLMEQLADDGDGNYYYIDTLREARRIFVYQLTGTLQVIAYEGRIQVDFNPEMVEEYRLIGYENRAIADEDFRNDAEVDAAEIGAGHNITGLYEIRLKPNMTEGVVATVYLRYQNADTEEFEEINRTINFEDFLPDIDEASPDFRLHVAVAEFSELLRDSFWAQDGSYFDLLTLAAPLEAELNSPDVAEFVELIRLAGRYVDVQ